MVAVLFIGGAAWSGYNGLVSLDQAVRAQWGQVENAYQRRADLIPNLVETVKGAANFEKETYTAVAEARARVGQVSAGGAAKLLEDPRRSRSSRRPSRAWAARCRGLMVVAERYPDLKATAAFRDLQSQLEGTENRITVERMRFNEAAQQFNTKTPEPADGAGGAAVRRPVQGESVFPVAARVRDRAAGQILRRDRRASIRLALRRCRRSPGAGGGGA